MSKINQSSVYHTIIQNITLIWMSHQIKATYQKFQASLHPFLVFSPWCLSLYSIGKWMSKYGLYHHSFSADQFWSFWLLKPDPNPTKINSNLSSHMHWCFTYWLFHSAVIKLFIHEMPENHSLNSHHLRNFLLLNALVLLVRFIWWDFITQQLMEYQKWQLSHFLIDFPSFSSQANASQHAEFPYLESQLPSTFSWC